MLGYGVQFARNLFPALHRRATFRQLCFFTGFSGKGAELFHRMGQPIAIPLRLGNRRACGLHRLDCRAPRHMRLPD